MDEPQLVSRDHVRQAREFVGGMVFVVKDAVRGFLLRSQGNSRSFWLATTRGRSVKKKGGFLRGSKITPQPKRIAIRSVGGRHFSKEGTGKKGNIHHCTRALREQGSFSDLEQVRIGSDKKEVLEYKRGRPRDVLLLGSRQRIYLKGRKGS